MKPRILVIEDNEINLEMMIFVLEALGLTVIPALNGHDGLAFAQAEPPDLIICDVQMPQLDGYAVLSALKSNPALARIPVIALTAMAMSGDAARLLGQGFDGYLSKPVSFGLLKIELNNRLPTRTN